jgi:hypothetical protein
MRKYIRHPSDIPIEINYANMSVTQEKKANNISPGGLSLQSDVYLPKDTVLEVRIPTVKPVFETRTRVVWCEKKDDHFDIGVEFSEQKEAYRARMAEQVCYIQHYKKEIEEKEGRVLSPRQAAMEWIDKYAKDFSGDEKT